MGFLRHVKRFLSNAVKHLLMPARQAKRLLRAIKRALAKMEIAKLHDYFNLLGIGLINIASLRQVLANSPFTLLFRSTFGYLVADTLFVALFPQSTKNSMAILVHHLVCTAYLFVPRLRPKFHYCAPYALSVEFNTWLQIARRTLPLPGLNFLFYATWVGLRLVWFPYLVVLFSQEWLKSGPPGQRDDLLLGAVVSQAFLSGLNYYWTAQLIANISARKRRKAARALEKAAALATGASLAGVASPPAVAVNANDAAIAPDTRETNQAAVTIEASTTDVGSAQ